MNELHGEKIDIVDYSDDPAGFVANALSPARVSRVHVVDAQAREAQVIVPDYQLSLAIGKEGQNARLAARLTGWRIDIRPDSGAPADAPAASPHPADSADPSATEAAPAPEAPKATEGTEARADTEALKSPEGLEAAGVPENPENPPASAESSSPSASPAAPGSPDPSIRFSPGVPDAQTR